MTDDRRLLPLVSHPDASAPTHASGPAGGVSRRSALQGLAAGLGLAIGAPVNAHDLHHPLAAHVAQRPAKAPATKARAKPQFFDAHQLATLTLVAELIVPGSVASGSPAYIDEVMAVEHEDVRQKFVGAIASLDAVAREQPPATNGAVPTFITLTRSRQLEVLEAMTTLPTLKSWVAGAHYSSEAGMKELGFTGNVFFQSFPACTHADGHE